jgi:6-phosphofructokinase 1
VADLLRRAAHARHAVPARCRDIVRVPILVATRELKLVPVDRYAEAEVFFG